MTIPADLSSPPYDRERAMKMRLVRQRNLSDTACLEPGLIKTTYNRAAPSCILFVLIFLFCRQASGYEIVLAKVSTDAEKAVKELEPMARFMQGSLNSEGVIRASVRLFPSPEQLMTAFRQGEVHWVTDTGFMASQLIHEAQAEVAAIKWKKGKKRYHSIIFVKSSSHIGSLEDLVGKTIVFEDEGSFSSYFLPRYMIEKAGFKLHFLESLRDKPQPDAVNYVFGRTEKNIALWVDKNLADAGVLNNSDWETVDRLLPVSKSKMRQLLVSEAFPRAYEILSASIPDTIASAIKERLLTMNQSEHRSVLKAYEQTSGFEALTEESLEQLNEFYRLGRFW